MTARRRDILDSKKKRGGIFEYKKGIFLMATRKKSLEITDSNKSKRSESKTPEQ